MNSELISIIVPVYNAEKYLPRCIDSIINQTYKNLEIILVDDGSPDNCGAICDEYAANDRRVKVIHKENGGVASTRNEGIDAAEGNYIAFVDSDDYIEPDFCERLLGLLLKYDVDWVCCNFNRINESGEYLTRPEWIHEEKYIDNKEEFFKDFEAGRFYYRVVWGKIYKSEIIRDIKFQNLKIAEDTCFIFEMFLCSDQTVYLTAYRGYNYIRRERSLSRGSGFNFDLIEGYEYIESLCANNYPQYLRVVQDELMKCIIVDYISLFESENKEECKKYKRILKRMIKQKIKSGYGFRKERLRKHYLIIKYAGFTVYDMILKLINSELCKNLWGGGEKKSGNE